MRRHLTYANVTATIALFLALGGGAVYAASRISTSNIERNAVTTQKIAPRAVTSKRLAQGAVRSRQLARRAVGSQAIAQGAVGRNKLQTPVFFVAEASGGSAPVTNGPDPYPIDGGTWTQEPGEINVIFGGADVTIAYDGSGSGSCQVYFDLRIDDQQVGGGQVQTDSTNPTSITASLGAQPEIDPEVAVENELTVRTGSNGDCTAGSTIDSSRFRVLVFG